ncbi:MAG: rhomboid family intramembrane serine protease [Desulfobacter sp.]|nr:rhomboid family intramembrane serine protease [Desulfobacter sp.]WDP85324.1 MAG: rhomboid family intramembrane serine protease [Desulfobacter sp.]
MKRVFQGTDPKTADLILVILASQSIETRIEKNKTYQIHVPSSQYPKAMAHLARYERENAIQFKKEPPPPSPSFFSRTLFFIMGSITLVHIATTRAGIHDFMVFKFGASSYFLGQGETFRAITALFLHVDLEHLLGNLAGLLIFAGPLIRLTGYGSGPFVLLLAATTGNLISAGFGDTARLSIGASTIVMAAAGLLTARQLIKKNRSQRQWPSVKGLFPLAAGATLMAMFSQGENTDLAAHFFGFVSGTVIGLLFFPLFNILSSPMIERICLALVIIIIFAAVCQGI